VLASVSGHSLGGATYRDMNEQVVETCLALVQQFGIIMEFAVQKEIIKKEYAYSAILVSPYQEPVTHFKIATRNPPK